MTTVKREAEAAAREFSRPRHVQPRLVLPAPSPEDGNDDACAACGEARGVLLCCDRCPRAWHVACLPQKLVSVPVGEWVCAQCTAAPAAPVEEEEEEEEDERALVLPVNTRPPYRGLGLPLFSVPERAAGLLQPHLVYCSTAAFARAFLASAAAQNAFCSRVRAGGLNTELQPVENDDGWCFRVSRAPGRRRADWIDEEIFTVRRASLGERTEEATRVLGWAPRASSLTFTTLGTLDAHLRREKERNIAAHRLSLWRNKIVTVRTNTVLQNFLDRHACPEYDADEALPKLKRVPPRPDQVHRLSKRTRRQWKL